MTTEQQSTFDRIRAFVLANEPESPIRESVSRTVGNYAFAVEGRKRGTGYVSVYEATAYGLIACESPLYFVFDKCEVESALNSLPGDERELRDAARDPRIPLGPDDDGEAFVPMSDEEMCAAQARAAMEPIYDPFDADERINRAFESIAEMAREMKAERGRQQWPNIFNDVVMSAAMACGVEVGW